MLLTPVLALSPVSNPTGTSGSEPVCICGVIAPGVRRRTLKLNQAKFRLCIKKRILLPKGCHSLEQAAREVIETPTLEVFERCLDVVLKDEVLLWMWQCWVSSWNLKDSIVL